VRAWVLLGAAVLCSTAAAEPGAPGYLLDVGMDARSSAMGDGAGVCPLRSAPVPCEQVELSALHVALVAGARYDALRLVLPVDPYWTVGFGVGQVHAGEVTIRDEIGTAVGETTDRSIMVHAACAWRPVSRLVLDAGVVGMYRDFAGVIATWTGVDCGMRYTALQPVTAAVRLRGLRLSGFTRGSGEEYTVPVRFGGGVTARLAGDALVFTGDLEKELSAPPASGWRSAGGLEWRARRWLAFRVGYDGGDPSVGVGVSLSRFRLDYAAGLADYAPVHRVSGVLRFDPPVWAYDSDHDARDMQRLVDCRVRVRVMPEVPCAVYHLLPERGVGVIQVEIANASDADAECDVWAQYAVGVDTDRRRLSVPAGSTTTVSLHPPLSVAEIRGITLVPTPTNVEVRVDVRFAGGRVRRLYAGLPQTTLLPADQFAPFVRDAGGRVHDLTDTLVTWVASNDPGLDRPLAEAADRGARMFPPVKLVGFQSAVKFSRQDADRRPPGEHDRDALAQVRLVYETLRDRYRMTYVNRPVLYNTTQRIKFPSVTLSARGNCIELSVLMAALLESIELHPVLAVFPRDGHAVVGWRVDTPDGMSRVRLLETNLFGEPFEQVLAGGDALLERSGLNELLADRSVFGDDGIYRREPDVIVYDVELVRPRVPPSPYVGERAEPLLPGPTVPLVPFLPLR
jgi:hypothetical protein